MKGIITFCIGSLLVAGFAGAEDDTETLNKAFKDRALAAMKHSDSAKRKAAYRTFQHLGKKSLVGYGEILHKAQRYHLEMMRQTMRVRSNPYIELSMAHETLESERERIMELVHTDWKKDAGKVRMLQNEMEGLARKHRSVVKLANAKTDSIDKRMATAMSALLEIQWELVSIERLQDGENAGDAPDRRDMEDLVVEDHFEAESWVERKSLRRDVQAKAQVLEEAIKHNAESKWASAALRTFSDHLNEQRDVLGLHPMLLEEKLSDASRGHSNDMKSLGFFSHTSPVKGKRSPADRARLAKFAGSWTGENIFMGSASPMAAYNGWFGSDGHRFIMFTRGGSNVIGVGVVGGHWTMMTGRQ